MDPSESFLKIERDDHTKFSALFMIDLIDQLDFLKDILLIVFNR